MPRCGNKPAGTAARLITLMIIGVSIAIAAITVYAMQRTRAPAPGSQVLPEQVAKQLGQTKPPAAAP